MKMPDSHGSFVQVHETIMWWTNNGIWSLAIDTTGVQAAGIQLQNLTQTTIADYYSNIPTNSIRGARGVYNPVSFVVQWLFRSAVSTGVTGQL